MLCMLVFLGKMMSESDLLVEHYPMATQQDSHQFSNIILYLRY